jgi:DNA polymerase-1
MARTLYILDGHSQIYRAYYAPFRALTSPAGEPVRATYVFCSMLLKFIRDRQPAYLAMALDGPAEKLQRRKLYAEYKITRKPMPDDLPVQIGRIVQIVAAMGIPILQQEGYEADDILATAAEKFAGKDIDVVLISRDKDLDQLVGPHVTLYDPSKDESLDAAAIQAAKGYSPQQAVDVQTLAGDTSDNVPGVPGVGPKTAAKLISQYGSIEALLKHLDELSPKLAEKIRTCGEQIALARRLVTLDRHVPIELSLESMEFAGIRGQAIRPIFEELGFNRLLDQLDAKDADQPAEKTAPPEPAPKKIEASAKSDYSAVSSLEELQKLAKQLARAKRLAVDTETTSTHPMWAELVGISLCWQADRAVYLPIKAPLGAATLPIEQVRKAIGPVLADPAVEKIGQNLKYDLIVLAEAGMELAGPMFDTMIAAHVLDSSRDTYRLDALAHEFLGRGKTPIEDLIGRGRTRTTMDAVPLEQVTPYACQDADLAWQLADVLRVKLHDEGLDDLFSRLEMPLMPVLAEMERTGILVDAAVLKKMETVLAAQADRLRERILALAGKQFNVDSPRQLAEVLFGDLKLPALRRTATGPSTDSKVLEQLAALHELPADVLDYRKLTKLISTYLTALAQCIHPRTHRVHTSFHQAATTTGRLSSSDPNLQNIPIRTDQGRQIRSAFVAQEGWRLLSADYSQVELRVLAHLCGDKTLTEAFRRDQDIHRIVAAEVFSVPAEEVTAEQRRTAKTVNFGIIYGQTAFGLATTLRISRTMAAEFIDRYRKRFPKIEEFLQACIRAAKADGYVETIFGRRRRITGIDSRNGAIRSLAERLAINSVVQGSAADLIKQAMVRIAARIRDEHRPSRMLLQIHDELLLEVPAAAVQAEREMVVAEMSGAIKLSVPLKVDVGVGRNWMEAK